MIQKTFYFMRLNFFNILVLGVLAYSFINIDKENNSEKIYQYEKTIVHNEDLQWYLNESDEGDPAQRESRPVSKSSVAVTRKVPKANIPDLDARYANIRMYGESEFVSSFINQNKNYITTQAKTYRLNAPVCMAMLILENLDVANKRLNTCAREGHNYGNIKVKSATDKYLSRAFLAHVKSCSRSSHINHMDDDFDSRGRRIHSQFYNWSSKECGLKAYILFLNSRIYMNHPNYAANFAGVSPTDHKRFAYAMYRSGYANISANEVAYDIKIMRIILQYDLVNKMQ